MGLANKTRKDKKLKMKSFRLGPVILIVFYHASKNGRKNILKNISSIREGRNRRYIGGNYERKNPNSFFYVEKNIPMIYYGNTGLELSKIKFLKTIDEYIIDEDFEKKD